MSKYEGLYFDTKSKHWKAFKTFFPETRKKDLEKDLTGRIEKLFIKEGMELDHDLYLTTIGDLVAGMKWNAGAFCLKIIGRWTKDLEAAFMKLVFVGDGQCEECGADDFNDYDYDDHGVKEHICGVCNHRQRIEH